MERWIVILGGAEIVIGGVQTASPLLLPQWVGVVVMAIGFLTIVYGIWGARKPAPVYYGSTPPNRWVKNWHLSLKADAFWPFSRLIPMKRAVKQAYDATRGTVTAHAAENLNQGNVMGYYACALFNGTTKLYGSRPPSDKLERVPNEEHSRCTFEDSNSAIRRHGETHNLYENLYIEKKDLKRRIKEIRALDDGIK